MHENNPFQNIKNYWSSVRFSITESAEKHLADFAGYSVYKDGKWYQSEGDVKKGKGISSDELWNRHGDEYKRHLDSRKGANEDKDSRDGESTRSEEVEHDGEQLDEKIMVPALQGTVAGHRSVDENPKSRGSKAKGNKILKRNWQAAVGRVHSTPGTPESLAVNIGRAVTNEQEGLFHKDSDRLLREHIRAEYEARGIYPTSREVQETYNHVVDLLEKTRASERDAILAQKHGTSGTETGLKLTKQELRRQRAGNSPQDYGDPMRTSKEEGERQAAHRARRNKPTRISPSSIDDTEELKRQGFSQKMIDLMITGTGH